MLGRLSVRDGEPLADALGGTRPRSTRASVWASSRGRALLDQVERYVDQGYKRIKMKIGPGRDVEVVRAVRER